MYAHHSKLASQFPSHLTVADHSYHQEAVAYSLSEIFEHFSEAVVDGLLQEQSGPRRFERH